MSKKSRVPLEQAESEGLVYYRILGRITLEGHSSLEALGLTSVVTRELLPTEQVSGIGASVRLEYNLGHPA
jgi:hypothetical protein